MIRGVKDTARSQVQKSTIDKLFERVRDEKYSHYLKSIKISKLRGLEDTRIDFDFPVTAIVGPNGSGKSSVLGAAGIYSRSILPRTFFAKATKYDDSMRGWSIEHTYLQPRSQSDSGKGTETRTTASYRSRKWNRKRVDRQVKYVGISRTIPAAERKNLYRFLSGSFKAKAEEPLQDRTKDAVKRILGRNSDQYIRVSAQSGKNLISDGKTIYASLADPKVRNTGYSEFHFGAGEASIITIVDQIESADEGALILIEEIENGLHPVATRYLIDYLIEVARDKSVQIIFTTHSNDALEPLPSKAVWAVNDGVLTQGKLDVSSLRALTGQIDTALAVFTEDKFSKLMAEITLRSLSSCIQNQQPIDLSQIDIYDLGGEGQVIKHTRAHNENPAIDFPVVGVLDGDMRNSYSPVSIRLRETTFDDIVFVPGDGDPEQTIFEDVLENIQHQDTSTTLGRLAVRLGVDLAQTDMLKTAMEEVFNTSNDPHLLFVRLGERLGFLPGDIVARHILASWCEAFPKKVETMWSGSLAVLPTID